MTEAVAPAATACDAISGKGHAIAGTVSSGGAALRKRGGEQGRNGTPSNRQPKRDDHSSNTIAEAVASRDMATMGEPDPGRALHEDTALNCSRAGRTLKKDVHHSLVSVGWPWGCAGRGFGPRAPSKRSNATRCAPLSKDRWYPTATKTARLRRAYPFQALRSESQGVVRLLQPSPTSLIDDYPNETQTDAHKRQSQNGGD